MSYRLYVRPVPPYADPVHSPEAQLYSWALQDAGGDSQASGAADTRDTIEQALAQNALENVRLIGLIPGDEAVFCLADIPARQARFIQQALPYAVEEQIAQDIDAVHLALGEHTANGYRVAAIDRERMAGWHSLFAGWHHTRLEAVYPEASLLPVRESGWVICLDGEYALMQSSSGEWLRMRADNLEMLAITFAAPSEDEVVAELPVQVFGTEADLEHYDTLLTGLARTTGHLTIERTPLEVSVTEFLAWSQFQQATRAINLCQGAYSQKAEGPGRLKPWKPLLVVASLWFVIQLGLEAGMGVYQQQQAESLNSQAMTIYRKAFPGDRRTHSGNVRRVIEGQLRVAGTQGAQIDFITLMKYTGDQYGRLPNPSAVSFNSVNYSNTRGELVVDVRADSYDRLSQLRNGLSGEGLNAQIGSVVNESSGARGRLTVSGG
ncbi:type II secretion system protein GspL [Marinobacter fuscus]|uniref:Type II secretion system protein L n=1 Tax=Marinobacter fuscus TaxID=2109942 RepID=A0A2T1KRB0_9GAMM|nr:type II secretion system protein GspL [Marinobacter fuscus]PSF12172.1 type II secretion system protein GspL [Marinobacter fuscus]